MLIAARQAHLDGLTARREALRTEGSALLQRADAEARTALTEEERTAHLAIIEQRTQLATEISTVEAELEQLRGAAAEEETAQRSATEANPGAERAAARTQNVEGTYTRRKAEQEGTSFFRDMFRMQTGMASQDVQARLSAHMAEARESGRMTERAIGTGNLGGLVPPVYLVDEVAAIARAGRPTANIVRREQLPASGQVVTIPRQTTGVGVAVQATQNSPVQDTNAAITDLNVPVVTIAGQQDVSRQSLERGVGVDSLIFSDLIAAYNVTLDAQVLTGSGAAGQMLGILNTAGITQMSAFTAAATAATFYSKIAGAVTAIQTGRFFGPTGIVVHPRRWGWLMSLVDASNRPLVVPNTAGPTNAQGTLDGVVDVSSSAPAGFLQGIPVYTDANIPTAVGTGPEDQVIVARLEDLILWEDGDGTPQQLRFEETTGGSLTVKLVAYGYAAFTAGRYPLATAIVGGNAGAGFGLVAPSF